MLISNKYSAQSYVASPVIFLEPVGRSSSQSYSLPATLKNYLYRFSKRLIDITVSVLVLALFSPFLALTALCIKITNPGPAIHKRKCVCKNGFYNMYKFRSMVKDAYDLDKYLTTEQIKEYYSNLKVENDPRITRIGKFIRKTSIDELPQLLNVLKGEMSLIGPRPVAPEEANHYGRYLDEVLSVKPGITGYWQTNGRSNATYESGKRQELELYYVRHQSFILDLKILFKTFSVVLGGEGAK